MGHRHIPNTSQIFEVDQDWGHGHPATGRSQVHIGTEILFLYTLLTMLLGNLYFK